MGIGSFFKGLGKGLLKAAPIATAFIPGLGPVASTLLSAAAGAGSGAVTGGAKGALLGGLMGGVSGGVGAAANAGKLSGIKGGLIQGLLSGDSLAALGQGLGGVAKSEAHNRGVALDAMMAGDEMKILADRERRAAEADLMKKVQTTSYLKGGGFQDTGPGVSANGKPFTKFDFGTRPANESEIAMATELEKQLMDRLHNPIQLRDYDSKMNPGKMEKALNWLAPITTTLGAARGAGKYQLPTPTPTTTPEAAAPTFTPAPVNPSGNPWARVNFTNEKILGN